jgi:transposase-like protein
MSLKRRIFTKDFKLQVIRQVQAGKPIAQAAHEHELHPNLIARWQKLLGRAAGSVRLLAAPVRKWKRLFLIRRNNCPNREGRSVYSS